ncbi:MULTISPECIES: hypothetical protein [Methylomonas]|uniref:hypothetical protein n=1 Tax=Methylomonas TaxID=416 RepID=UPI0012F68704|nr:hypothetical protein [Methylomonas koyamae]
MTDTEFVLSLHQRLRIDEVRLLLTSVEKNFQFLIKMAPSFFQPIVNVIEFQSFTEFCIVPNSEKIPR